MFKSNIFRSFKLNLGRSFFLFVLLAGCYLMNAGNASAQTIYGCADKVSGQLRRINPPAECKNNEMPVNWSIQGPQGIQGIQGIQGEKGETGATGAVGEPGLSKIYSASANGFQSLLTENPPALPQLLKQISLPAGNYFITAKINIYTSSTSNYFANCSLSKGPNINGVNGSDLLDYSSVDGGFTLYPFGGGTIGTSGTSGETISLSSVLTLAAPGNVDMRCSAFPNGDVSWRFLKLSAVQVNEVNVQ
jgi:hypothetical protein